MFQDFYTNRRKTMSIERITCQVGTQEMIIETGKMAKLADGAVTVQVGETVILVTAVSSTKIKEGQDFFPLSVEYKEKAAAAGRFPGGYFKREGRPTEKEILTCRMTDRPLRPLFPKGYLYDTQVVALLLSADGVNDSDILSINGASAALCVSDIPFAGPIAAVRIGLVDGEFVVNPTHDERAESLLDLVYVGLRDKVIMIEGGGKEVPDAKFKDALIFAQQSIQPILDAQEELARRVGKAKRNAPLVEVQDELLEVAYEVAGDRIEAALYKPSKIERGTAVGGLRKEVEAKIKEKYPDAGDFAISQAFEYLQKKAFRISILDKGVRCDGRDINTIRPLSGEVG
jgi:polyribonucleotide nucleotidyltransferase